MVLGEARRGLPLAVMGVAVAVAGALCALAWSTGEATRDRLRLRAIVELLDVGSLFVVVLAYEVLRLASAWEERRHGGRAPRMVAAPFAPALFAVLVLPGVLRHHPRLLEATWWAALLLVLGTAPAVLWCLLEERIAPEARRWVLLLSAAGVVIPVLGLTVALVLMPEAATEWSEYARTLGFRLLPRWLTAHL